MPEISIDANDGGSFGAYLAAPPGDRGPGLVVIQEIFGVNDIMRNLCDAYAAQGFIAVCPDLFWRQQPGVQLTDKSQDEWNQAFAYMKGFDFELGVGDLAATIAHVRAMDGCTGKAGTVGYCLGGSLAYLTGCFTDTDAAVGYYPVQIENQLDHADAVGKPVMLHIAELDGFCPPDAQQQITTRLGANSHFTVHRYAGVDHAFARPGGDNFNKQAADQANNRTAAFLKTHLA